MAERFVSWIVRWRRTLLVTSAVLMVVAGYRTLRTYQALRSDLEELLPTSAPSVTAFARLRERLPTVRFLGVVVDTARPENLPAAERLIDELALRISAYPEELVRMVRSHAREERRFAETFALQYVEPEDLRRLREATERRRDWAVERALGMDLLDESEDPRPEIPIDELRRKYEGRFGGVRPHARDRFVSDDGRTLVLLVQAESASSAFERDQELLGRVQADVAALGFPESFAPDMRIGYAGDVATRVEETRGLASDLTLSGAVVLCLVVAVVAGFFRSFRALFLLGLPLACGTLGAFALVALPPLSIRHLNSNTAFLGSIVVGNGVNSGIVLLARFREERLRGAELEPAISEAVARTWLPTLAAALAAAAAYGSLVFTDFRGFNQFGWIGGLGMILCWASTFLLLPALLAAWGGGMAERSARFGHGPAQRFATFVAERPRGVLALTALMVLASAAGIYARLDDFIEYDLSKLRRRDSWISGERYWGKRMDQALGRYLTPTVVLASDASEARTIEAAVLRLRNEGKAGGLIASSLSAATWLPPRRLESLEEARRLAQALTPRLRAELAQTDRELLERALAPAALRPVDVADIPSAFLTGLRELDGRIDRTVLVYPKLTSQTWDAKHLESFTQDLRGAATIGVAERPVAGPLLLASDIASAMKTDGPRATLLSLFWVLAVCWLAFRGRSSPSGQEPRRPDRPQAMLSVWAIGSLFVGVLLTLGVFSWSGARLNFSNFVALPITFGVGADYAINMLKRYQAEADADAPGLARGSTALGAALGGTGGAVILCSLTTMIGFGSLLMAENRALFSFGWLAMSGELMCLATAVIVVPAALRAREVRSGP